jgi:hypothetical protein
MLWVDPVIRRAAREILGQAGFHRPIAPVIDHDQARGHGVVVKPGLPMSARPVAGFALQSAFELVRSVVLAELHYYFVPKIEICFNSNSPSLLITAKPSKGSS